MASNEKLQRNPLQVVVLATFEKLIKGIADIATSDYKNAVRTMGMPIFTTINGFNASRAGTRKMANAQQLPILVHMAFESASIQLFQAMCSGGTLGTTEFAELMSIGTENTLHRKLTLKNTYATDWKLISTIKGAHVEVALHYSSFEMSRTSYDQAHKKLGQITVGQSQEQNKAYSASS